MDIDVNEVMEVMAKKIADLIKENSILQATIMQLTKPKEETTNS
jgi:hypothetical protein